MGKQISFYLEKKKEEEFFEYIKKYSNSFIKIKRIGVKIASFLPEYKKYGGYSIYIAPKKISDINYIIFENGNISVDSVKEQVIDFSRPNINNIEKMLYSGRLWIEMKYFNDKGDFVEKSKELEEVYIKLKKWIIKNCPYTEVQPSISKEKIYISPECKRLVEEEGYTI